MSTFINRRFLEQTSFDSSSPNGLGVVVHQFEERGEYAITFLRDDQVIERALLSVVNEAPTRVAPPQRVNIDLEQVQQRAQAQPASDLTWQLAGDDGQRFVLRTKGYAVFATPNRADSYAILAERTDGHDRSPSFDSRRLGAADLFALTLIRPGAYSVLNVLTKAQARIAVAYPTIGKTPYRPPEPITVECTERGFTPDRIALQPAQGIVFRFGTPSRLVIELVEPNDGPAGSRRRLPRWRKPRAGGEAGDTGPPA